MSSIVPTSSTRRQRTASCTGTTANAISYPEALGGTVHSTPCGKPASGRNAPETQSSTAKSASPTDESSILLPLRAPTSWAYFSLGVSHYATMHPDCTLRSGVLRPPARRRQSRSNRPRGRQDGFACDDRPSGSRYRRRFPPCGHQGRPRLRTGRMPGRGRRASSRTGPP